MLKNITKVLSGDPLKKQLDKYGETVNEINGLEPSIHELSDDDLRNKTSEFRSRISAGETLEDLLVEAFAVVREAAIRSIGMRHFDVQLVGGIAIHQGNIIEMKTGEGKTLVATMPIFLNALEGKGVHLITVNDYLARRDARWMGPVFDFLGLSVGVLQEAARTEHGRKAFIYDPEKTSSQEDVHQLTLVDRKQAYGADVTYGTNNEFGFDYLRDNMARTIEARSQRGHNYAILDEVDNILIDEARTPLIISGPSHDDPDLYLQMARVVKQLRPEDFEVSEKDRTVALNEIGEDHVEELLNTPLRDPDRPEDITPEQARLLGHLEQALRAEHLFARNKDYVIQGGKVIIVDEFTGRLMAGRRWSDGLHQAVEAKEGVKVRQENVTYATITLQNYFRMYTKLAGMTGTAVTEAEEFSKIYDVDVVPLPTNLEYIVMTPESDLIAVGYSDNGNNFTYFSRKDDPEENPVFWQRKDYQDVVYRTEEAKLRAIALEILRRHAIGQPMLVGTTSVELSERLSNRLRADALQKLMNIEVLRDAYFAANDLSDDGIRIETLEFLNRPLGEVKPQDLRPLAKELNVSLNPANPDNLERILRIMELDESNRETVEAALKSGIAHNVLNAKKHDEESAIIAWAGSLGAVTIATNMAGRGVDIKLGGEIAEEILAAVNRVLRRAGHEDPANMSVEERIDALGTVGPDEIGIYGSEIEQLKSFMADAIRVREVGGLHVLGSERHDSRRIDNQLRGRAARQGDAGSSQFFLSLEDELMRLFGGIQVSNLMQRLNIDDSVPIGHSIVNRTIEQAQTRVEGANFDTRKHLLDYDDVLNQQREVFYNQRNRIFTKDDLSEDIASMLQVEVEVHVESALMDPEGPWRLLAWLEETQPTIGLESDTPYPSYMLKLLLESLADKEDPETLKGALLVIADDSMNSHGQHLERAVSEQYERVIERIDDQIEQRVETAEIAVESAMIESEESGQPVNPQQLVGMVEQSAGLKIQMDSASLARVQDDPGEFLEQIPQLVEASMGVRLWAGLLHSVERRVGEPLGLEPRLTAPIDWDQAEQDLMDALKTVWRARTEGILEDIRSELDQLLQVDVQIDQAMKLRLLIQLSYGQRSFFDKKTHQRRSVLVARLSYPFYAANLIQSHEPEDLTAEVLEHLEIAQLTLQRSLGKGELERLGNVSGENLDERTQKLLKNNLPEETLHAFTTNQSLTPAQRDDIAQILGSQLLTRAHRELIMSVGDQQWVEYLTEMEALRTSIGLEAYAQRDPLVQYKSRAFDLFRQLLATIRAGVVSKLFRLRVASKSASPAIEPRAQAAQLQSSREAQGTDSEKPKKRRKRRRKRR